jgi:DNA-3-methyladenine glycosylase
MRKLTRRFFSRPAIELAPDLIGAIIVHRLPGGDELRARIVETEAYIGAHDLACHAARGRTKRTEVMFGAAGHAYVYFIYGMHEMFNVVAAAEGDAQAVLVRAAEPLGGWQANLSGPGRFARGLRITRADYGRDLTTDVLFFLPRDAAAPAPRIVAAPRVGVDYSGDWKHAPLRFFDTDSRAVSRPRPPLGSTQGLWHSPRHGRKR